MTMYDHVEEYAALKSLIDEAVIDADGNPKELDDSTRALIAEMAEQWKADFQHKAERVCRFRADTQAHIDACKAEAARLSARAKVYETRLCGLNFLIQSTMGLLGLKKMDAGTFALTIAKNPPSLVVDDADKIPADYFNLIPATTALDNARVKAALSDGLAVPGARLVQGESLRVR